MVESIAAQVDVDAYVELFIEADYLGDTALVMIDIEEGVIVSVRCNIFLDFSCQAGAFLNCCRS